MECEKIFRVSEEIHQRPIGIVSKRRENYETNLIGINFKMEICSGDFKGTVFDKLYISKLAPARNQYVGEEIKIIASGNYPKILLFDCIDRIGDIFENPSNYCPC